MMGRSGAGIRMRKMRRLKRRRLGEGGGGEK
jgi:hypothetical protein